MTNRVETQKIQERRVAPPVRPEWPDYAKQLATPRHNALMILIPLLGFTLAVMLMLSFAMALQGNPASHFNRSAAPMAAKSGRMAVFVL
jgi:hypothetical protein